MITRQPRTHTLVVEIPLHLNDDQEFDYDPVHAALSIALSISRLAVDGVLCGDIDVELRAAEDVA